MKIWLENVLLPTLWPVRKTLCFLVNKSWRVSNLAAEYYDISLLTFPFSQTGQKDRVLKMLQHSYYNRPRMKSPLVCSGLSLRLSKYKTDHSSSFPDITSAVWRSRPISCSLCGNVTTNVFDTLQYFSLFLEYWIVVIYSCFFSDRVFTMYRLQSHNRAISFGIIDMVALVFRNCRVFLYLFTGPTNLVELEHVIVLIIKKIRS